jgi:hypothetical protein
MPIGYMRKYMKMKKILLLIIFTVALVGCSKSEESSSLSTGIPTSTIEGESDPNAIISSPQNISVFMINNSYGMGDTFIIGAFYDENVTVTGSPRIELNFNSQSSTDIYANYLTGSGSGQIYFSYTVAAGDIDPDGINLASSIDLNGGTMVDVDSNGAEIELLTTSFTSILIDSTGPAISSFVPPANATYSDGGGELLFQVNFTEAVIISGTPQIAINLGGSTVNATYQSGSGSSGLEFSYSIQDGDDDADGIQITGTMIDMNGGSVTAVSNGASSSVDFSSYLTSLAGVLVDTSSGIIAPDPTVGVITSPTTTSTSLSVAWAVPFDNNTSITNYIVQYREQGQSSWITSSSPTTNSTIISGLSTGVPYEIRVAANNGLLGPYSLVTTVEIFDILSLNPVAWLSATNVTNGGSEPLDGDKVDSWEDITGSASAATEVNTANQPTYETNVQNGLPAIRFDNLAKGLEGTFTRTVGTDLTFVIVGQFDTGSTDKCLFEFSGGGSARGFFIDRRYAANTYFSPASTKGALTLWTIQDSGGSAIINENTSTEIFNGSTAFNTDFTGTGNYVLGDDITGGNRMNGYIAEFLIFDRALTAQEISTLETYLQNKWGL